jgi:hypothetical protein
MRSVLSRTPFIVVATALLSVASVLGWNPDTSMAQENHLYAGGWDPNVVWEYVAGTTWNQVSQQFPAPVLCLYEYAGQLYAGTGQKDTWGASTGQVWRYDAPMAWTLVGDGLDTQVCQFIEFRGDLYVGTGWGQGRLYRYDGGSSWTLVVDYTVQPGDPGSSWSGFRSLFVWDNIMYMGDLGYDLFGHWDGTTFTYDEDHGGSCIYDLQLYQNEMFGCAYWGRVYNSSNGTNWTEIRGMVDAYSWELEEYRGDLYLTTGSRLEVYGGGSFMEVWREPDGNELISMMCTPTLLVIGTGEEAGCRYGGQPGDGLVYTWDGTTAQLISDDLGGGINAVVGSGDWGPSVVMQATWGQLKTCFQH